MNDHRFTLEPYHGPSTRHRCPACQTEWKFARYIDTATNQHIDSSVGRCDRENQCGYHMKPRQFFEQNPWRNDGTTMPVVMAKPRPVIQPPKKITVVPVDIFKRTLADYGTNNFIQFLSMVFPKDAVNKVIEAYFIGTFNKAWWGTGSVVFWQIDSANRIRAGKVMQYNPETGKRLKNPERDFITWIHKVEKIRDYELSQCFFGEHLLKNSTKPVAIVESEKTAIISSLFHPEFIWLACGQLNGLNATKATVLAGRKVVLFPDVKGYEKWKAIAKELSSITTITVSDFLERNATDAERADGCDLADYLLKLPKPSREPEPVEINKPEPVWVDPVWGDRMNDLGHFFLMVDDPRPRDARCEIYRLHRIAERIFQPGQSYLKEWMVKKIVKSTGLSFEQSRKAFSIFLDGGAIFNVPETEFFKFNSLFNSTLQ